VHFSRTHCLLVAAGRGAATAKVGPAKMNVAIASAQVAEAQVNLEGARINGAGSVLFFISPSKKQPATAGKTQRGTAPFAGSLELYRHGQNGQPVRDSRHPRYRTVCRGDAMHSLSATFLLVGHGSQDRGQDHARTVNPGQGLM
jgi:hypothetical protein